MMPLIKAKIIVDKCDDMLNASVDKALREVVDYFVGEMIESSEKQQMVVSRIFKNHMRQILHDKFNKIDNML